MRMKNRTVRNTDKDAFAIRHYGRLIDRTDRTINRSNYSWQRWEYENEIYLIFMANGFILKVAREI